MESPHMSENLFNADIEIGQFVILKHIKNEHRPIYPVLKSVSMAKFYRYQDWKTTVRS